MDEGGPQNIRGNFNEILSPIQDKNDCDRGKDLIIKIIDQWSWLIHGYWPVINHGYWLMVNFDQIEVYSRQKQISGPKSTNKEYRKLKNRWKIKHISDYSIKEYMFSKKMDTDI